MSQKDFSNLGEDIKEIVSGAINSMDFEKLNQDIKNTVQDALEQVKTGLQTGKEKMHYTNTFSNQWQDAAQKEQALQRQGGFLKNRKKQNKKNYFAKHPKGSITGILLLILGVTSGASFGITALVMFCIMVAKGFSGLLKGVFFGFFISTLLSVFLAYKGKQRTLRVKRFHEYVRILGDRTFCQIEELASQIGKNKKFVINDIRKMISKKMFLQGHLDDQETCLIVTEESYYQYRIAQNEYKKRTKSQQVNQNNQDKKSNQDKKVQNDSIYDNKELDRELLSAYEEGKKYLDEISKVKTKISEPEISFKISHMEVVIKRIFGQVQTHPEQLEEIRRFMKYYLPTTLKLLTAYNEFSSQPVQGENITNAKHEIEETIDTINGAFEKLLDSLFEAAALDISTDISVMHTMLAQEGLTKNSFEE